VAVVGFLAAAAALGLLAGVGSLIFLWVKHAGYLLLWESVPDALGMTEPAYWWILLVLVAGSAAVWLARRLPGGGGHSPLGGLAMGSDPRAGFSVLVAALISLSIGAVLGPEAPLMALGSMIAAVFAARMRPEQRDLVMMIGAVASFSIVLGNPLVSAVLVLEMLVIQGSAGGLKVAMAGTAILVAMGFGYLIQVGFEDWPGIGESVLAVPNMPAYPDVQMVDLLLSVPVALLVAGAAVVALRLGARVDLVASTRQLQVLLASGLLLALLAIGVNALTGEPVSTVLFSGQADIGTALGITSAATLVLIAVAKTLAYGISLGGGYRGGLVFPAVYLGVVVAALVANGMGLGNVAALAAAGMAAGVAATVRLPFTAVLLAVLLGAGAGLAITTPAILGAAVGLLLRVAADAAAARSTATGGAETGQPASGIASPG
jgi:H+/Cl- antiporter ClcA